MTLLDEIIAAIAENPTLNQWEVEDEIENVETVDHEFLGSGRWTEQHRAVFKRGDEYVALNYEVASTEMQEGSEGESTAYAVEPVQVTVTKYERLTDY